MNPCVMIITTSYYQWQSVSSRTASTTANASHSSLEVQRCSLDSLHCSKTTNSLAQVVCSLCTAYASVIIIGYGQTALKERYSNCRLS